MSAYLGRYRGQTRLHTESNLHVFLGWCTDQKLDPLTVVRADVERYLRTFGRLASRGRDDERMTFIVPAGDDVVQKLAVGGIDIQTARSGSAPDLGERREATAFSHDVNEAHLSPYRPSLALEPTQRRP